MTEDTYCEALIAKADPDRYLSSRFAEPHARRDLAAIYAFNLEVAKTRESVSEPMLGEIRLQWWREAVEEIYSGGEIRKHEVAEAFGAVVRAHELPRQTADALIDARAFDLYEDPMPDMAALETYVDATSGSVMRLAAQTLIGAEAQTWEEGVKAAGLAYGLAGLLMALPYHAARRQLFVPEAVLKAHGAVMEDGFGGEPTPEFLAARDAVIAAAADHLATARRALKAAPPDLMPAVLPAALVNARLKTTANLDPFAFDALRSGLMDRFRLFFSVLRNRL